MCLSSDMNEYDFNLTTGVLRLTTWLGHLADSYAYDMIIIFFLLDDIIMQ